MCVYVEEGAGRRYQRAAGGGPLSRKREKKQVLCVAISQRLIPKDLLLYDFTVSLLKEVKLPPQMPFTHQLFSPARSAQGGFPGPGFFAGGQSSRVLYDQLSMDLHPKALLLNRTKWYHFYFSYTIYAFVINNTIRRPVQPSTLATRQDQPLPSKRGREAPRHQPNSLSAIFLAVLSSL